MSEDTEVQNAELEALKTRATALGVKFHPSIGQENLQVKVDEELVRLAEAEKASSTDPVKAANIPDPVEQSEEDEDSEEQDEEETLAQKRVKMKLKATAQKRVMVTCMNPNKREWTGEVFAVSNKFVSMKKFVQFGEPWHVPEMILTMMKERQCQVFYTVKDKYGNATRKGKLIKEFAIEELPPLTKEELKDLAQRQAMANGTAEAVA